MKVAVHQPNYAPWCGYFTKMLAADAFVFLDDAQLPQGRSYVSRVRIARGSNGEQWLTAPVQKGAKPIRDVEFADEQWAEKHLRTLRNVYSKTAHASEVLDFLQPLYEEPGRSLAEFNIRVVSAIADYLGWEGRFHRASERPGELKADARIAELVAAVGGGVYLSGVGGENYQAESVYAERGVALEVHEYEPLPYDRSGWPWVGGLSVLDALFHTGRTARDALRYR
jgi:hypothetical protein